MEQQTKKTVLIVLITFLNCSLILNAQSGKMDVGESKTVEIKANEPYNGTGVYMVKGQHFEFSTSRIAGIYASSRWISGSKVFEWEGGNDITTILTPRHSDIKWMALVGEIFTEMNTTSYSGTYVNIGRGRRWIVQKTGYLICFANDHILAYNDNKRSLNLTIKRIK